MAWTGCRVSQLQFLGLELPLAMAIGNGGYRQSRFGMATATGCIGNGNGIYVLVYIPGVGWVLMPLSMVMGMMGGSAAASVGLAALAACGGFGGMGMF